MLAPGFTWKTSKNNPCREWGSNKAIWRSCTIAGHYYTAFFSSIWSTKCSSITRTSRQLSGGLLSSPDSGFPQLILIFKIVNSPSCPCELFDMLILCTARLKNFSLDSPCPQCHCHHVQVDVEHVAAPGALGSFSNKWQI